MKILGCTGGIGSGKSYIVRIFNAMGLPSYDADSRAKSLYAGNPELLYRVAGIAGPDIIKDGVLQKEVLASRIFKDKSMLSAVEGVVHPAVFEDMLQWKAKQYANGVKVAVIESAILLEKPLFKELCDNVMTVVAPLELRIGRIMKRDSCTRNDAMIRIASQTGDEFRIKAADFTIFADNNSALLPQLMAILEKLN
ncbi:MAG: dephospho-CoA kinase [Bacteroidales bacterium]|jgi:dephospho-CoA kinase|nr:dephospho-CoA kinase [Bacteroidales bacterium]MCI2122272.1 dephospho-CoA kinase [Bacteroidales bacterium]MCI2144653.1 dephospho-CoA kinase [Bacteroidales bacterium]